MSDANLQGARINSLAVLVVAYVGLSFAFAHHARLSMLLEARKAVANILLTLRNDETSRSIAGLGDVTFEEATVTANDLLESRSNGWRVTVTSRNSRWGVSVSGSNSSSPYEQLRRVAADFRVSNLPKLEDLPNEYVRIYQDIEAKAGEGVEVPGTGMRFPGTKAVWACAFFIAALLIVMRDRVQQLLPKPQAGDRWLVVDGRSGLERMLAIGELLGLLFAPSALTAGLFLMITSQVLADGADSSLSSDVFVGTVALGLLLVNAWLSLTTVSSLLALRERRAWPITCSRSA